MYESRVLRVEVRLSYMLMVFTLKKSIFVYRKSIVTLKKSVSYIVTWSVTIKKAIVI